MTTIETLQAEFIDLTAKRNAILASLEDLKTEREKAIAREQEAKADMDAITAKINAVFEETGFNALSKKLGIVASTLTELKRME